MNSAPRDPFSAKGHDHSRCIQEALASAAELCRRQGVRLTLQRRRVLEIVWRSHRPVGAYEILEELRAGGLKAAPPTVYRALEFLREQGLVHRLETLNAFTGCVAPGTAHAGQFLVCTGCGNAAELADAELTRYINESANGVGFEAHHQTIEISGLCPLCRRSDK